MKMNSSPPRVMSADLVYVSALFGDTDDVDRALAALSLAGLPRDRIEVAVSPEAARRFYAGQARGTGRETLRYAGVGGIVGLIVGSAAALGLLATGASTGPVSAALVQLLGPNVTTIGGALAGGAVGAFVHRAQPFRLARAAGVADAVVVVVTTKPGEEAQEVAESLVRSGGRDVQQSNREA